AAAGDGRRRSRVGPGLPPCCGPWTLLGGDQWGVDQWRGALALACAQPKGCTRSIHATDPPSRRSAAASRTSGCWWSTPFKVLEVHCVGEVCAAFLPAKKACWAHQLRYLGVDHQYPGVF